MALLTEEDVRRMSNQGTRGPVVVNRDQMLTPGARDYLREHRGRGPVRPRQIPHSVRCRPE